MNADKILRMIDQMLEDVRNAKIQRDTLRMRNQTLLLMLRHRVSRRYHV